MLVELNQSTNCPLDGHETVALRTCVELLGMIGHGFFRASCSFTRHPSGPAIQPLKYFSKSSTMRKAVHTYHSVRPARFPHPP